MAAAAAAAAAADGLAPDGPSGAVLSTGEYAGVLFSVGLVEAGLAIEGGDLERVLPPRRLVAVVRAAGPGVEFTECTDADEGGRAGGAFVISTAGGFESALLSSASSSFFSSFILSAGGSFVDALLRVETVSVGIVKI